MIRPFMVEDDNGYESRDCINDDPQTIPRAEASTELQLPPLQQGNNSR